MDALRGGGTPAPLGVPHSHKFGRRRLPARNGSMRRTPLPVPRFETGALRRGSSKHFATVAKMLQTFPVKRAILSVVFKDNCVGLLWGLICVIVLLRPRSASRSPWPA